MVIGKGSDRTRLGLSQWRAQKPKPLRDSELTSRMEHPLYDAERVRQENEMMMPPEDAAARWEAIWMVELYSRTMLPALADNLRRYSKQLDQIGAHNLDEVASWAESLDRNPVGRGYPYSNLGYFVPPGSAIGGYASISTLPDGVRLMTGQLHGLGTGYVVGVYCLVFEDARADELQSVLRQPYEPEVQATGRNSRTYYSLESSRERRVSQWRYERSQVLHRWLSDTFPGVYSNTFGGDVVPSVHLVTMKVGSPFVEQSAPFLHTVGLDAYWNAWELEHCQAIRFGAVYSSRKVQQAEYALALNWNDAAEKGFGAESAWDAAMRLSDEFATVFVQIALFHALDLWSRRATDSRAALDEEPATVTREVYRQAAEARAALLGQHMSAIDFLDMLEEYDPGRSYYGEARLRPIELGSSGDAEDERELNSPEQEPDFNESWRAGVAENARSLRRELGFVQDRLALRIDTGLGLAGLRLQRVMYWLTILVVVLSLLTVVLTGLTLMNRPDAMETSSPSVGLPVAEVMSPAYGRRSRPS